MSTGNVRPRLVARRDASDPKGTHRVRRNTRGLPPLAFQNRFVCLLALPGFDSCSD